MTDDSNADLKKCENFELCGNHIISLRDGDGNISRCAKCDITFGDADIHVRPGICEICMSPEEPYTDMYRLIKCDHAVCKNCFLNLFWPCHVQSEDDVLDETEIGTRKESGWYLKFAEFYKVSKDDGCTRTYDIESFRKNFGIPMDVIIKRHLPKCPFCRQPQLPTWWRFNEHG